MMDFWDGIFFGFVLGIITATVTVVIVAIREHF